MGNRLYVDIHILQTVPPSCVNRDDTGSPKTAVYGGVTRARVSSQAWKKAVRDMFRDTFAEDDIGVRTKRIQVMVTDALNKLGYAQDANDAAKKILTAAGLQEKTVAGGKDAPLFFMSPAQAKALAELAMSDPKADKKTAQKALVSTPSIDLALFGRMVADEATLNIDASCQVAHAISTHKVLNEYDYFTAVDDFPPEDKTDAGAAMMGTVEYNSATLYRYATIAVHDLRKQLGKTDAAAKAVRAFVDAFARSMPTGKVNTFANRTSPNAIYVAVREDQPLNLVGAFECPIKAGDKGYVEASAEKLVGKANEAKEWIAQPLASLAVGKLMCGINGVEVMETLAALLCRLESEVENVLK
ncbi:MAG: type I-E CRISPR-associated protein Cas7/Cse4/CasC [Cystobacterineae bacterium]|nr:type I-E CRISPR-associated protein Cas7/Cse4/CasC [Cystobacterineae bacterium]